MTAEKARKIKQKSSKRIFKKKVLRTLDYINNEIEKAAKNDENHYNFPFDSRSPKIPRVCSLILNKRGFKTYFDLMYSFNISYIKVYW